MAEQDTGNAPETDASATLGTQEEDKSTQGSEDQEAQDKVDKALYEAQIKENQKLQQELNLRRNKEKELELKALEDSENWKGAYEKIKQEKEEIEAERQRDADRREVEAMRTRVFDEYPPEVAKVAKDLGLYWDDAQDFDQAEKQLRSKLDVLKTQIGGEPGEQGEEEPIIPANNPANPGGRKRFEDMSADEMRGVLPHAEPR